MTVTAIPTSSEYALRAMVCLAARAPDWVTARELAAMANVPPAFLSKVLRRLVRAQLIEGQRGHHGGFRLGKDPQTVRIVDVLEAARVETTPDRCAFGFDRCNEGAPCPLHAMHKELQHRCRAWAEDTRLADVDLSLVRRVPA